MPVTLEATNRLIATGGVIIPMEMPIVKIRPKWTRLIPNALTSGRKTGVSRITAEDVSMNTPAIKIIMEIRNMIT